MKRIITMTLLVFGTAMLSQAQDTEVYDWNIYDEAILDTPVEEYDTPPSIYDKECDLSKLNNGRALSEVNIENNVDAYPWLSPDGLRLYFTQSVGGNDQIVMAERSSLDKPFEKPVIQSFNINGQSSMSCWLTKDELTIYFTASGNGYELYKATRENRENDFESPTLIDLGADDLGFISGPSLTQDGKELFLYQSNDGTKIMHFQLVGENRYEFVETLNFPKEMVGTTPGYLSYDGLNYYALSRNSDKLCVMKRDNLEAAFEFDSNIEVGANFHQVAMNDNLIVLCYSPNNTWSTNDLFIADNPVKPSVTTVVEESPLVIESLTLPKIDMEIFPNPSETFVNVRFDLPDFSTEVVMEIFDASGKVFHSQNVNGNGMQTLQINVSDMPAGAYFCRLVGKGLNPSVKTIIVK